MKIIKIIFINFSELFFNEYLSSWAHKILPIKVFSSPQNVIIVSLQAAQYTFQI